MNHRALEGLKSEELALRLGFLSTPGAVRRFLAAASEVHAVRQALREGAITEESVRRFVADLMKDLERGNRFPHEVALAALAVALERLSTGFAEEFLRDLARLRLAEMSLSIRVARECLRHRGAVAQSRMRRFRIVARLRKYRVSYRSYVSDRPGTPAGITHQVYACRG